MISTCAKVTKSYIPGKRQSSSGMHILLFFFLMSLKFQYKGASYLLLLNSKVVVKRKMELSKGQNTQLHKRLTTYNTQN